MKSRSERGMNSEEKGKKIGTIKCEIKILAKKFFLIEFHLFDGGWFVIMQLREFSDALFLVEIPVELVN